MSKFKHDVWLSKINIGKYNKQGDKLNAAARIVGGDYDIPEYFFSEYNKCVQQDFLNDKYGIYVKKFTDKFGNNFSITYSIQLEETI